LLELAPYRKNMWLLRFHRASPSTSLDKRFSLLLFIFLIILGIVNGNSPSFLELIRMNNDQSDESIYNIENKIDGSACAV
jgi:hypothetical protein